MFKSQIMDLIADVTWLWGQNFFLETSEGNFIWSDPNRGGDNTIRPYSGTLSRYLDETGYAYGRDKGKRIIGDLCGPDVILEADGDVCSSG